MRQTLFLTLSFCGALLLGGCAGTVKQVAKEAAPTATTSAIQSIGDPQNQAALLQASKSPAVKQFSWESGNAIGNGLVAQAFDELGLGPPAQKAPNSPVSETADDATRPTTLPMAQSLPRIDSAVRSVLSETIATVLGPQARQMAGDMAQAVGEGLGRGISRGIDAELIPGLGVMIHDNLGPALAGTLHDQIVPAIASSLREQLAPAIASAVQQQLAPAVDEMLHQHVALDIRHITGEAVQGALDAAGSDDASHVVRGLSKSGSVGVHDAVVEIGQTDPLDKVTQTLSKMTSAIIALLVLAGCLTIALFIALALIGLSLWRKGPLKEAGSEA